MNAPQTLFYPEVVHTTEEGLDVRKLLYKYIFKYWYLYILFSGLMVASAYCYIKYVNPLYEVKSRLLIKEDKNKSSSPEDMLQGLKLFGTSENVTNEIYILSSVSLMERVVKNLNLGVTYYWQDWIKTIPSYKNFPIVVDSFTLAPLVTSSEDYRLKKGLVFKVIPLSSEEFELIYKEESLGPFQFGENFITPFGVFQFNKLQDLDLNTDTMMYVTFRDPKLLTEVYLKDLRIGLVDKQASVIELSLQEVAPIRAVEILNTLVELYNVGTIEDKNKVSENTLKFIEERLIGITKDLMAVESNVEQYKRKNEISSASEKDLEIVLKKVSEYTESQTELEVQLNILESIDTYLDITGSFDLIPANLSVSAIVLKDLVIPYNELVLKRQRLLETATSTNPLVQSIEQQLLSLRTSISDTVTNIKQDLRKKITSIASLNKELMARVKRVPTQERGLLEIKRQQIIKENLYLYLLKKKEETHLTLAATTSNARIIDTPRTTRKPIAPQKALIYLSSFLGGLFIPFLFVVGKDLLQDSIQDEEDIKEITKIPIIGSINKGKKNEHIVVKTNTRTAIAERFRLIRTNLQFVKRKGPQTILLTSSISGEGKTFVAINLAMSFTLLKKRTILLGMDLRKPKLQEYLEEVDKPIGMTEYILGDNTLEEVIQCVKEQPDLDYILSGAVPFNPNELLSEPIVSELFERLQKEYEVIIIDAPPVGLVSDAFLLNEFITNTIYVVRVNVTKKQMVINASEMLKKARLKNASILLNGVNEKGRYGYGGSYGYYEN